MAALDVYNERAELLATKGSDGNTGVYWALANGHADTGLDFGELRKLVPENERAALPAASQDVLEGAGSSSTRINPKKLLRW